ADSILVLACGTGVQCIGDRLDEKQVHPGAESLFVGETKALGRYEEKCSLCNECLLEMTDGICPVTRCSKGLLNGPCGGYSEDGKCEVDPDKDCAWLLIYERLRERGHLDKIAEIQGPHDHSGHHHPRSYRWPKPERPKKTKQEEPA
ncbi:MAG: methylenetetrahydrofolate reductase C-terminal domain-containing protein, partial [Planctomycetota bacterium]|nr:methylenetetrahydrofolate reductase C-terminal domain-containing protein [Planctomycetota bacterium]